MTTRKLGRGLDALITQPAAVAKSSITEIDPNRIQTNPDQPRKRFSLNELEELKASIEKDGMLQPVLVRERNGEYELIAGERRVRAARELGMAAVPAMLIEATDDRRLELALIENIHRENLNPIELAQAFRQLLQLKNWTQEVLATSLNLSRPAVTNTLRLLDLPEDVQNSIARGQITMGHAKILLSVSDEKEQRLLFEKIAEEKLSVRDLEMARPQQPAPTVERKKPSRKSSQKSAQLVSLEEELGQALGTRVRIRQGKSRGLLSIEFYTNEDFDRLRKLLLAGPVKA